MGGKIGERGGRCLNRAVGVKKPRCFGGDTRQHFRTGGKLKP